MKKSKFTEEQIAYALRQRAARFHSTEETGGLRDECLNVEWFTSLEDSCSLCAPRSSQSAVTLSESRGLGISDTAACREIDAKGSHVDQRDLHRKWFELSRAVAEDLNGNP